MTEWKFESEKLMAMRARASFAERCIRDLAYLISESVGESIWDDLRILCSNLDNDQMTLTDFSGVVDSLLEEHFQGS